MGASPSSSSNTNDFTRLPEFDGFQPRINGPGSGRSFSTNTKISENTLSPVQNDTITRMPTFQRVLSDNELSYYLPSRVNGVNDMHLHSSFNAPRGLLTPRRVALVWAILRVRHPLLTSKIEMKQGDYSNARFIYTPPPSPNQAYIEAHYNLEIHPHRTEAEYRELFSNGPRMLSPSRPTCLCASWWDSPTARGGATGNILIACGHYVSDGQAMCLLANDFFVLLGGLDPKRNGTGAERKTRSEGSLAELLVEEWTSRWGRVPLGTSPVPTPADDRISSPVSKLQAAGHKVDFVLAQSKLIGGQVFPRVSHKRICNVARDVTLDRARTEAILARCKVQGVTVQNAIFVLCNYAWIRTLINNPKTLAPPSFAHVPMMMYTAANLRPYLCKFVAKESSYYFLAVTYFNIVLPSFMPKDVEAQKKIFWHRAREVKAQARKAIKNPMFIPRSRVMNEERGKRSKKFAKEDDETLARRLAISQTPQVASKAERSNVPSLPRPVSASPLSPQPASSRTKTPIANTFTSPAEFPPAPSVALLGLSLLGDLDEIFKHDLYPSIDLLSFVSSTRKNHGGLMLFSYTFKGRLWISLGWDAAGFPEGLIEEFWERVAGGIDEFLLEGVASRNGGGQGDAGFSARL